MRVDNHIDLRHVILHHFKKEWTAAQSMRDLDETYANGTISKSQRKEWFRRLKSPDWSLEDKKGRGRPSDFDDQALLETVEEDQSRMLAYQFHVSHACIVKQLKKLGKVWKLGRWVRHEQKAKFMCINRAANSSPDN